MTNYTNLSDFEINKRVADALGVKPTKTLDVISYKATLHYPDYCNNWSDAGPIIVENKISVIWVRGEFPNKWEAVAPNHIHIDSSSSNPLRAAMIVFLMMKESGQ